MKNKKEVNKVALVKCRNYNQKLVDKAVQKCFELLDFDKEIKRGKRVLIKPNIVGSFKTNQQAITTNPAVIEAVCKILKKKNCRIFIGDSSFTLTSSALKDSGIEKIAKKYGKAVVFDEEKLIKINDKKAKILKTFRIPKVIKQSDIVVNMPKLKTHILTKYTGAIKNLLGCIPGGMKQRLHKKAPNEKSFSNLLVDIYQNIKPEINIMDSVLGMDGKGPTSGKPKKAGYIIASKSSVSLDVVASKLMGYKPKKILVIREAVKRKLGNYKFKLVGEKKIPNLKFKKPKVFKGVPGILLREKPIVVDEYKCVRCGLCAKKCPMHAIKLDPYPVIDKNKCIRCFCCIEVCPHHALSLREKKKEKINYN